MVRKGELLVGIPKSVDLEKHTFQTTEGKHLAESLQRYGAFAEPSDFPKDVRDALRGAATIEWMLIVLGVLVVVGMVATAVIHR